MQISLAETSVGPLECLILGRGVSDGGEEVALTHSEQPRVLQPELVGLVLTSLVTSKVAPSHGWQVGAS